VSQHKPIIVLLFILLCLIIGFGLGLEQWLTVQALKDLQAYLETLQRNNSWWFLIGYGVFFSLLVGFYVPGALPFLILAGALFDFWTASILISLTNALGATMGFLMARWLFYERFQERYGARARKVNEQMKEHGGFYLLFLRIVPVMPSPLVNLLMGLTPIGLGVFFWVTLFGRVPLTIGYVKLGQELSEMESLRDIWSKDMLMTIAALTVMMVGARLWMWRRDMHTNQTKTEVASS